MIVSLLLNSLDTWIVLTTILLICCCLFCCVTVFMRGLLTTMQALMGAVNIDQGALSTIYCATVVDIPEFLRGGTVAAAPQVCCHYFCLCVIACGTHHSHTTVKH